MRAGKFLCAVLCALGATALVPGVALAVPVNNTPPQVLDSNSDPATAATVGQTLTCSPGDWTSANDFAYEFKRGGTPIGGFSANDTYQVASADIGHALSCTVRATDTGDSMTADQDSSNSVDAFPAPTLNITRFSPAVSGNIGEHVQGVIVTVSLQRPDSASNSYDVAAVTVPTDANGHWQGTLVNHNPDGGAARVPWTDGDLISVKYAQGTAPGGTTLPADGNYTLFFGDLNAARISPDGTTGAYTPEGSCATGQFIVNGGAPVTETGSGSCTAPLGTPVTDEDTVLLRENRVKGDGSTLTLTSPVGLVGIGFSPNLSSGIPVCTGDLVSGEVSCEQLKAGSFTLTRARGGQSVNFTLVAGNFGFSNTTIPGGLEAGDVVTLKKQGGTRALTTLHLSPALRFDEVNGDISGGTCSASQWIGSASSLELTCPQDGAVPSGVGIPGQPDELSAGGTQVSVPQFDNVIPADDDSVQPSFQAYVDSDGPPPTTITLTLFHRNSDGSNGAQAAGPVTIDPANGGAVSGLATGRYNAVWRMTDTQGDGTTHDTNTVTTQLTVQPGSQGPQGSAGTPGTNGSNGSTGSNGAQGPAGSQGPAGPVGPRGPAGRDAKVTCVVKPAKGKKKPKITCTVKFAKSAGRVRARLMRGNRVYASGTSVGGVLRLNPRRALPRGTYKLVLIDRHGVRTVGARVVIR